MRYIFPHQFGLHNVFTSKVDPRDTAMPFKDYTLREKDIHSNMCRELGKKATDAQEVAKWKQRTPKRLRGDIIKLVERLRIRNQRCSYMEMLRHYCPIEVPIEYSIHWRALLIQTREYLYQRGRDGGRAHFSRKQMYGQSQSQLNVTKSVNLRPELAPFSKPVSQILPVQQHTSRPFVAQSYLRSYPEASGVMNRTNALSCIG